MLVLVMAIWEVRRAILEVCGTTVGVLGLGFKRLEDHVGGSGGIWSRLRVVFRVLRGHVREV